jgi:hypothetical protein
MLAHLCGPGAKDGAEERGEKGPPPPLGGLLKALGYQQGQVMRF